MKFRNSDIDEIKPEERRWSWLEVNLDAVRHNIKQAKAKIGPNCKLLIVVKADAYGHGAVEIAKLAIKCGAAYLGVATVDEAMELRDAGILANILILSQPPVAAIPLLVKYDIMPSVHTSDFAIQYAEAADRVGKMAPYHLAVNTGMNRVGVRYNEVLDFLKCIDFHRALEMKGIFTHFAASDESDDFTFNKQMFAFKSLLAKLDENGYETGLVHAANSAAIFRYPESHFDMVRLGVCMYGYYPSEYVKKHVHLMPTMSVHARIVDERILAIGEGVSYGHKYRSRSNVKICTIPIGYADGLHRCGDGKIGVIYKGRTFPQVGSICMDMCMFEIDMTSAVSQTKFNAQIGDEVILVGQDGEAIITIEDLAAACNTINYEMVCSFSRRMPVIYV